MRVFLSGLALLFLATGAAGAQAPATSFADLAGRLSAGDTVFVTDIDGRVFKGTVIAVTDGRLDLTVGLVRRTLTQADVRRIERRRHSVRNGTLIGFATGFVVGAAWAGTADECEFTCFSSGTGVLAFGSLFGAFGAGIGASVGWALHRQRLIYEQASPGRPRVLLVPVVTPARSGLAVRIDW